MKSIDIKSMFIGFLTCASIILIMGQSTNLKEKSSIT